MNVSAGPMHRVERKRRRHEKEEAVARRIGGFWRGRGCIPEGGCYGRSGREGRKRRRICLAICGIVLAGLIVMIVLIVVLTRRAPAPEALEENIWLNLTNFPPIPTGVLTVAGTDNTQAVTGCVQPPTMWSCALPKEQHQAARAAGLPYAPNQPSLIFQIQFDNNTRQLWNFVGEPPHPAPVPPARPIPTVTSRAALTQVAPGLATLLPRSGDGEKDAGLEKRQQQQFDPGFVPTPPPPSFQEIWFLGNTTDGIVSDIKAGEPTPFYISLLADVNSTVGPNVLSRRQATPSPQPSPLNTSAPNLTPSVNLSSLLPPEELNPDGTGAPARFMPRPLAQQPLRLYDRGLPTEHYGFYAYFNRTIYLRSVTPLVNPLNPEAPPLDPVPADLDGGAPQTEARFVVTWAETRFKVSIWTRMSNTTRLLGNGTRPGRDGTTLFAQPGTMPYPVTITTDQHGGNPARKRVYHFSVDERQRIHRGDAKLIENNLAFGGTLVNNKVGGDPTQGGFDGGTGGCKCEWVNFKVVRPVGGSGGQG